MAMIQKSWAELLQYNSATQQAMLWKTEAGNKIL